MKFTDNANPLSKKPSEIFTWSSNEFARFKCQVDDEDETDCGQGKVGQYNTPFLPDGDHVFKITPIDQVGNRGKTLEREWIKGKVFSGPSKSKIEITWTKAKTFPALYVVHYSLSPWLR